MKSKPEIGYGTRFDALTCDEEDSTDFPDLITATKTVNVGTKMPKWMDKKTQKDKIKILITINRRPSMSSENLSESHAGQAAAVEEHVAMPFPATSPLWAVVSGELW